MTTPVVDERASETAVGRPDPKAVPLIVMLKLVVVLLLGFWLPLGALAWVVLR